MGDRFYVTRPGGGEALKAAGNTGTHVRRLSVQHGRDTRRAGRSVSELAGRCGSGDMKKDSWKSIWNHAMCKKIRAMEEEESLFARTGKSEKGGET